MERNLFHTWKDLFVNFSSITPKRKPNFAVHEVVRVTSGFEITACMPGIAQNLQKHFVAFVQGEGLRICSGDITLFEETRGLSE